MPTYSIAAPDGKTYQIDGPEGATTEQVRAEVIRQHPHLGETQTAAPAAEFPESLGAKALRRIAPDVTEYLGGLVGMVQHPVRTAGAVMRSVTPLGLIPTPQNITEKKASVNAIAGAVQHPIETAAEHPFQTALLALPGLGEVADVANLPRMAGALRGTATAIDPVALTAKAATLGGRYAVSPALDAAARLLTGRFNPSAGAGNALLEMTGGEPANLLAALRQTQGMPTTPGYTPTLAERAYAGGVSSPTLAAAENRLYGASPEVNRQIYEVTQRNVAALNDQLERVNTRIQAQAGAMTPAAKADLETLRSSIQDSLTAEQGKLSQIEQGISGKLSGETPQTSGAAIAQRGKELRQEYKAEVKDPAYKKAFDLAGDARIDVSPILAEAERVLDKPLTSYLPDTAPPVIRRLQALADRSKGMRDPVTNAPTPPTASLAEVDAIRKAVNDAVAKAKRAPAGDAAPELANLGGLHGAIDRATMESAALTPEAKAAYADALAKYRTEYVPKFRTGVAADLFSKTNKNLTRVLPDDTVRKFLANETSADQFFATFGADPAAQSAMRNGIERLYRDTVKTPAQHAKFMADYGDQLAILDKSGMGATRHLEQVGKEVSTLAEGRTALEAKAKSLGVEDMGKLVDSALSSPEQLDKVLTASNASARKALADEVVTRATQNLGDATGYLSKNETAIKKILKAAGKSDIGHYFDDLVDLAKWHEEAAAVKVPRLTDTNIKAKLDGTASAAQLHDLKLLAEDVKRQKAVEDLAQAGAAPGEPKVRRVVSEGAADEVGHVSAGTLNAKVIVARNIFKMLARKLDSKVSQELARVMYENPDAAINLIEDAAKAKVTKESRRAAIKSAVEAPNKLTKPSIAINALAPENQQ